MAVASVCGVCLRCRPRAEAKQAHDPHLSGGAGSGVRRLPLLLIFIHPFNQDNLSYPVGKND